MEEVVFSQFRYRLLTAYGHHILHSSLSTSITRLGAPSDGIGLTTWSSWVRYNTFALAHSSSQPLAHVWRHIPEQDGAM